MTVFLNHQRLGVMPKSHGGPVSPLLKGTSPIKFGDLQEEIPPNSWFADKRLDYLWTDCSYSSSDVREAIEREKRIAYLVPSILIQLKNNTKFAEQILKGADTLQTMVSQESRAYANTKKKPEVLLREGDFLLRLLGNSFYEFEFRSTNAFRWDPYGGPSFPTKRHVSRVIIPIQIENQQISLVNQTTNGLHPIVKNPFLQMLPPLDEKDKASSLVVCLEPFQYEGVTKKPGDLLEVGLEKSLETIGQGAKLVDDMNQLMSR
jgi:hypothetical protein